MSKEQLKAFLETAKNDAALQNKLKAAKSAEEVVAIAKQHGHEFTADKLGQLSDEELENVAGGLGFCIVTNANLSNVCISFDCFHT
jgi:predicted ribosomally synthesized peptide with nif11-like leader